MQDFELPSDVSDAELPSDVEAAVLIGEHGEAPARAKRACKSDRRTQGLPMLPPSVVLNGSRKDMIDSLPCETCMPHWLPKDTEPLGDQHDFMEAQCSYYGITRSTTCHGH